MVDDAFFVRRGPFGLDEIGAAIGARSRPGPSDARRLARGVASFSTAGPEDVCFLGGGASSIDPRACRALACIVNAENESQLPEAVIPLVCANPKLAFAIVAEMFHESRDGARGISPAAGIHPTSRVGADCSIQAGANVAARATIGDRCNIQANAVIGEGVSIGDDCFIGANVSLSHAVLGNRVILHRGVCVGQDGFGFVSGREGHVKMPQLGRVLIGDDVEVGANSTIDRGTLEDTTIGDGTKIDNLVQIGHNTRIGRHCLLCSQVGVAGSAVLGDGVVLGGQVGIADHTTIGAGAQVLAKSGVSGVIPAGEKYAGIPAHPVREWYRTVAAMWRLGKKKGPRDGARAKSESG